jgi:hypothetical protein
LIAGRGDHDSEVITPARLYVVFTIVDASLLRVKLLPMTTMVAAQLVEVRRNWLYRHGFLWSSSPNREQ